VIKKNVGGVEEVRPSLVDVRVRQQVDRLGVEPAGFEAVQKRGLQLGLAARNSGLVAALLGEDRLGGLAAGATQGTGVGQRCARGVVVQRLAARAAWAASMRAWISGSLTRKVRSSSSS
jgi:hypothetical protein